MVVRVSAGSPMAKAGVALGDRLVAIDGVALESQADMLAKLAAAGEKVVIDVDRKGRIVRLEATNKPD